MNIIILGDKYQKRMKSRGCVGLIKTNNKNILSNQYSVLKKHFPYANIIYVYGFDNKKFISYIEKNLPTYNDIILVYNENYDKYNNTYSLNLVKDYLNTDCLILFGDHVLKNSMFDNFKQTARSQVFVNKKIKNKLGCIINDRHSIENISYDLENYLSEIYFISKDQVNVLKNLVDNPIYHNYFIFEIMNKMIDQNQELIPNHAK